MKWIFLILIIACGHKEPPLPKLQEPTMANLEKEGRIFSVKTMPLIAGTIRISTTSKELYSLNLTNQTNNYLSAIKALTWKHKEESFHDTSHLRFRDTVLINTLPDERAFKVSLTLDNSSEQLTVYLIDNETQETIWKGAPGLTQTMNRDQLDSFLKGYSSLRIFTQDQSWEQILNWKERYNNLFYYDGENVSIFYIAKDMKLTEVFERLKVSDAVDVSEKDLWSFEGTKEKWFYNEQGRNIAIMSLTKDEVRKQYTNSINPQKLIVSRVDGKSSERLIIEHDQSTGKSVLLRIKKSNRVTRNFEEWIEEGVINLGSMGGSGKYRNTFRKVSSEQSTKSSFDELLENLMVTNDNRELPASLHLKMLRSYVDDYGNQTWELSAEFNSTFALAFQNSPSNTWVEVGLIKNSFGGKKANPVNSEASWKFDMEAYLQP